MDKFTDRFRLQARQLGMMLDLEHVTTSRQRRNGTIAFHDPQAGGPNEQVFYLLYSSGYVRRRIVYEKNLRYRYSGYALETVKWESIYQLNRQRKNEELRTYFVGDEMRTYWSKSTERIMATPLEMLGLLFSSVINYRTREI